MQFHAVAPVCEPVTLETARLACRCDPDVTDFDGRLQAYIMAARAMAEHETGQRLITQTWDLLLDDWPRDGEIVLPQCPAQAIVSVKYTNTAGTEVTLDNAAYRLDARGFRSTLRPAKDTSWPTDLGDDVAGIAIRYTAGFGSDPSDVPSEICEWILAHVVAMYEQPAALTDAKFVELPYLRGLLDRWRVYA